MAVGVELLVQGLERPVHGQFRPLEAEVHVSPLDGVVDLPLEEVEVVMSVSLRYSLRLSTTRAAMSSILSVRCHTTLPL